MRALSLTLGLLVGLPSALAAHGASASVGSPDAPRSGHDAQARPPGPAVEIELVAVLPVDADVASLLVLREKNGAALLPIFVARAEGAALDHRLKQAPQGGTGSGGDAEPRPTVDPNDLLAKTIAALGGKVTRVEIKMIREAIFRAQVTLQQGDQKLEVEARPSDSVALALAWNAPIFATREVMDKAALSPEDLERMRKSGDGDDEGDATLGPEQKF
jgi:bifunctional DNase/RNase